MGQGSAYGEPASWEMGLLAPEDWSAKWIARPDACLINWESKVLPAPLFRKDFSLPAAVRRARAYVCGLGYSEFYLNGRKVSDRVLDPNVSQYDQRVRYVVHDVTDCLKRGRNAVGMMLGNGWYNCHTPEVWHFDKASWRDYPKLRLQLEIELTDGRTILVASDPSWKVAEGPIRFDGLRNGEIYNARLEREGWAKPGYDDAEWQPAAEIHGPRRDFVRAARPPLPRDRDDQAGGRSNGFVRASLFTIWGRISRAGRDCAFPGKRERRSPCAMPSGSRKMEILTRRKSPP